jgi:MazG family protein
MPKKKTAKNRKKKTSSVGLPKTKGFVDVVHRLRKECPWDKKQTHRTLIPYLLEEAYETIDAIESGNTADLKEELGDLLLQIALHSEIAAEKKKFTIEDVSNGILEKMVRRHPHIFGDTKILTAEEQTKNWAKVKGKEKPNRSLLAGTPKAMPALQLAQRYCEIAASVNFDWKSAKHTMEKVDEELEELRREIDRKPQQKKEDMEMELGDLLFTLSRLAGHLGIDAERALRRSAGKFERRFSLMERSVKDSGKAMGELSLEELETHWNRIKSLGTE